MSAVNILISAGELSGDMHGAKVVTAMQATLQAQGALPANIYGIGGDQMAAAGVTLKHNFRSFGGVMGFEEVFKKLRQILSVKKEMVELLDSQRPDALLVIDFPDFNLRLAKAAFKRDIPVIYFIPPKVWAWRSSRIKQLKKYCKKLICILPFELPFYQRHAVNTATFVGHPFCDDRTFSDNDSNKKAKLFQDLGLNVANQTVVCLIGSRKSEVEKHLPIVTDTLRDLKKRFPQLQAIFCLAPTISGIALPEDFSAWAKITAQSAREVMQMGDVGIIKSGTSTLEAAFARLPSVCIYKGPPFAMLMVKLFVKVSSMGLPNLIVPGAMPELFQEKCTPEAIVGEVIKLLTPNSRESAKNILASVVQQCQFHGEAAPLAKDGYNPGASDEATAYGRAAQVILKNITKS